MEKMNLKTWSKLFNDGSFNTKNVKVQIEAGWYDWFCSDLALAKKTEFLGNRAIQLFKSKLIDTDKNYIWFKNNCPCVGPLYDDFRIADIETGDVQFCICNIKKGCHGEDFSGWEVWDYSDPKSGSSITSKPVVRGSWKEVKAYFYAA